LVIKLNLRPGATLTIWHIVFENSLIEAWVQPHTIYTLHIAIFVVMHSQQVVCTNESVALKQNKMPIWKLEVILNFLKQYGFDLGIHFTYWGKSDTSN